MGKAIRTTLKIAALAGAAVLMFVPGANAAAAAFIASTLGVSAGVAAGIVAAGISLSTAIGASALAPRPRFATTRTNADRLRATIDPRTPRKTAWGETALATDIRDQELTGDQEFLHTFIVCAAHRVQSIQEIWFDDELAWSISGGVAFKFAGYLTVIPILEGSAANAINISPRMGSSRRYTGCAYVYLRYKLTGNSKRAESPFAQGITSRITIRGQGILAYDPRQDSTVPGGSGPHRADNQATWTWGAHCRNPSIALLSYLLGWRINGELSVGKGIPKERIDLESFAVAANICDEAVAKPGGGTEPRYRCDGLWSEGENPTAVTDAIKATMNADLDDMNGRLRVTVLHNDLASPVADFDDDDILGDFVWTPVPAIEDTINVVRGGYTDASNSSLYQMVDYPQAEGASLDGIDRIDTLDLPLVQSASQAQRLAGLRLRRNMLSGTFKCELQVTGWRVEKNSILRLSFSQRGWVNKLFRVMEMDLRQDGIVPVVLREEDPDLYDDGGLLSPLDALAPTPFNYQLDPTFQVLTTVTRNVPRGTYSSGTTYIEGDQVVFSGSTYQLIVASSLGNPPPDPSRWVLVAAAGTGTPGADGVSNAVVFLYRRSATLPSTLPTGTFTYTFATGLLSGGTLNGWTQAVPAADGNPLYVIAATAAAAAATDTIPAAEFSAPVLNSGAGISVATIQLFQRSASAPAVPGASLTYTFSTNALSGSLGSWSRSIPAGSLPLYVTQATALSVSDTDTIAPGEWSAPVVLAQDGAAGAAGAPGPTGPTGPTGAAGANGADGAGTFPIYRRSATQPATPSPSSGVPSGWFGSTGSVPAGAEPMWISIGTRPNTASNWTWQTPTRFEAVSAVGTGDWQYVTESPSPELTFALGPGESRVVNARVFYPAPTGPGTVAVQIEYGEVGGSWTASSGTTFSFNAFEPAAAAHTVTVTNSTGVARAYRARATSVVTGLPGVRDAQSSVVRV